MEGTGAFSQKTVVSKSFTGPSGASTVTSSGASSGASCRVSSGASSGASFATSVAAASATTAATGGAAAGQRSLVMQGLVLVGGVAAVVVL